MPPTRAFFSRFTPRLFSGNASRSDQHYYGSERGGVRSRDDAPSRRIQMADLSIETRKGDGLHTASAHNEAVIRKEMRVDVESIRETESEDSQNQDQDQLQESGSRRSRMHWVKSIGAHGEPAVRRVESQSNLIEAAVRGD